MPVQTIPLRSEPGIKRDGTRLDGDFYVDGQWVRFQRGLPRKMGGYRRVLQELTEVSRGLGLFVQDNDVYCHSGSASLLSQFRLDENQISSPVANRTPAALVASPNNKWMFSTQFDSSALTTQLLAHVAPNNGSITNSVGGQIFSGNVIAPAVLAPVTIPAGGNATGGIVSLHPYLFYYGSNGIIGWSAPGAPTDLAGVGSGVARPWGQKIIKGLPLRSGGSGGPSGIFWAYDAVIRATFTGGATVFNFDTLATDTSILSPDAVVDFDGVFYWAGVDRFLMFNGVVREVPNQMNLNWFFDGINKAQTTKVFAFKITRYGEIWWCYPRGSATECTHAVIFNVREGAWYDTELPANMRTAAQFCNLYAAPIMTSSEPSAPFKVWSHEQGLDLIDGLTYEPIDSFFETGDLSPQVMQGAPGSLRISRIEPDFIQTGDMSVVVTGQANSRAPVVDGLAVTFPDAATQTYEQVVAVKDQRRQLRVRFRSNALGGDYQMGQVIGHFEPGDGSITS